MTRAIKKRRRNAGALGHRKDSESFCNEKLVVPEQREQNNDRQRHAQQPKQHAASKSHGLLLLFGS